MSYFYFDSIDSTNEYLKAKSRFLDDWSVVSAAKQENGKGRNNRLWESENNKNLLCSILIKDQNIIKHIDSLSLLTGVVIYKLLVKLKIKNISIKWPNDIYVNNKKICGVLLESISNGNSVDALVIGVGLNLNQSEFKKELNATSYFIESNKEISIKKVLRLFIKTLKKEINKLLQNKTDYIELINLHNYLFDKKGFITIDNKKQSVIIKQINSDNSLSVMYKDKIINIRSDEVSLSNK